MAEASKRTRCNDRQKIYLVDFMVANRDLALGTFTSPMGAVQQESDWGKLAEELTNFGPRKSVDQWKITWRDLKSKAKAANAARAIALDRETGNPERPVKPLPEINNKIISIIGRVTSQGLPGVPESSLSGEQPSSPQMLEDDEIQEENVQTPPTLPLRPASGGPVPRNRRAVRRIVPTTPVQNILRAFRETSQENLAVLKEISSHLKKKNEIAEERNRILLQRNNLLEIQEISSHLKKKNEIAEERNRILLQRNNLLEIQVCREFGVPTVVTQDESDD